MRPFALAVFVLVVLMASPAVAQEGEIPSGFDERCHSRTFGGGQHCHVVPPDSEVVWKPGQAGTIVPQMLVGFGAGLVSGAVGAIGFYAALGGRFDQPCLDCEIGAIVGAAVFTLPGVALGVWGTGQLLGGDGSFGWTFVGALAMGCLGAVGAYHMTADYVYTEEIDSYDRRWPSPPAASSRPARPVAQAMVPVLVLRF